MKKYFDLLVLGASTLFAALIFAFMGGKAEKANVFGLEASVTSYEIMKNDLEGKGLIVVAMIFVILVVLAGLALIVLNVLKKELGFEKFIGLGAAFLALLAGIFFFCIPVGSAKLAGGAVFAGLFGIFAAAGFAFYGIVKLGLVKLFK